MRVVGVRIGTRDDKRHFISDFLRGHPAALVRARVPLEDAIIASFQPPRLSATSRPSYLLRTLPPEVKSQAAEEYEALIQWGLASIIAEERAVGWASRHQTKVCDDLTGSWASASFWPRSNPAGEALTTQSSIRKHKCGPHEGNSKPRWKSHLSRQSSHCLVRDEPHRTP